MFFAIKLLMKLGLGRKAARRAFWLILATIAITVGAALFARGEHYRAEAAEAHRGKEKAESALTEQQEAYRTAHAEAVRDQTAAARAIEAKQAKLKEQADNAYIEGLEDGRVRADRYAAANRCVQPQGRADPGSANAGGVSRSPAAAGEPVERGSVADLVAISRADFNRCTAAAVRLGNAVDWAGRYPVAKPPGN